MSEQSTLQPGDVVEYRQYLRSHLPGISDVTAWRWVKEAGVKRFRGPGRKSYALKADLDRMVANKIASGEA